MNEERGDLKIRLPITLEAWLRKRAAANFRSINAEVTRILTSVQQADQEEGHDDHSQHVGTARH